MKWVTWEEAKRTKSKHTVKMMLNKEHQKKVVNWTRAEVAWNVKMSSLRKALLIDASGDRKKAAIWRLDECEVCCGTNCLLAVVVRMSCDYVLDWVGEEVLKE